eukprot:CAMPEP_0178449730 /NCGR_PEP_ID=MMETSP0689_2-20121128/42726_1 /TAXON_ID=160604 /ORGANISM="Amphidinium massartii, Strain CS-259" /LENGTH=65 /DNA_ID=CAMNT_0020075107 /DNA_START=298 /DNA_END=492 /DNA_ORIENTATION=-
MAGLAGWSAGPSCTTFLRNFVATLCVDDCAVDNGRKLSSASPECVAHRAEAQRHVQVLPHSTDEE